MEQRQKKPMELLNLTQVAKFYGCTTETVKKNLKRGEIPPPAVEWSNKSRRWSREQLEDFIRERLERRNAESMRF